MPRRRLKIDAVNELSMTERETILGLLRLGWSERRIAREGGHHRTTVRRIRHEAGLGAQSVPPRAKCPPTRRPPRRATWPPIQRRLAAARRRSAYSSRASSRSAATAVQFVERRGPFVVPFGEMLRSLEVDVLGLDIPLRLHRDGKKEQKSLVNTRLFRYFMGRAGRKHLNAVPELCALQDSVAHEPACGARATAVGRR